MKDFLDIAFSFPTVIFTVASIFLLGFWTVTTLIGAGADALDDLDLDFDTDTDVDVDVDTEIEPSGDANILRGALKFLGVTGMPLLIGLNLFSLGAWFTSVVAISALDPVGLSGAARTIAGFVVLILAVLVGSAITRLVGRRFAHVFKATYAHKQREFVGQIATITTSSVSATFGQAELRDEEGASLIVQVRCAKSNDLTTGDRALVFDLDPETGEFQVSPDTGLAP